MKRTPRPRRCPCCLEMFTPVMIGLKPTRCCLNAACVLDYAQGVRAKEFDKVTRQMKADANEKNPQYWADKAQKMCNKYILARDRDKPCISCGNTNNVKYDAGHYLSRGHTAALRFNEFNIHKQCSAYCNQNNSGQAIRYRQALVNLYGEEKVLWLEGPHELPRYRIEDYKRIHDEFKKKLAEEVAKIEHS
jgi:hypothetical protein